VSLQQKPLFEAGLITFNFGSPSEERQIQTLLSGAGLPFADIHEHLIHFIIAKRDEDLVGCIGLEVHGNFGLLRSLVVAEDYRGRGIAKILCEKILEYATKLSITNVYLLTDTAEGFFGKLRFEKLERSQAPPVIQSTKEFAQLCPSTAIFMCKTI
jgi:amino-acid N-acetyltransferase